MAVNLLAIAILLGYLALVLVRLAGSARRKPREALLALGLAGLALAVRWLSAPRTVIGTANADLSHVVDVATWARAGLDIHLGVTYPPAWRGLLYVLYRLAGPSLDTAFVLTTVAGALGTVPVYLLARRLAGSVQAGVLAGLAFAAYPTAIYFANGFGLEVPASVLLVASFVHLLAWLDGRHPLDAALYVLSMLALVQTRMEGLGAAPVLVAMHLMIAVRALGWQALKPMAPWVVAGALLSVPFLVQVARLLAEAGGQVTKAASMLIPVEVFLFLALAVAWDSRRSSDPARRFPAETSLRQVFVASLALLFLGIAVGFWPNNPFVPTNILPDGLPFYELHVTWPYGVHPDDRVYPTWLVMPGVLPVAFLLAWFAALAPAREGHAPAFPPAVAFLALLPWFGYYLTRLVGTGIAPVEGLRHHVLFTGVVAVSVGLGAFRIARHLSGPARLGPVALVAAGVVLLSPVVTHRSYVADNDFDAQREFAFVREAVGSLPDRILILVPDDVIDLGRSARFGPRSVAEVFRTDHLFTALGWVLGIDIRVAGVRAFAASGRDPGGPMYFFQGLECFRAVHPATRLPSCRVVREVAKASPVAVTRFPNRPYTGMEAQRIGIRVPEVELAFFPVQPQELDELRQRLARPDPETPGR